MKVDAKTFPDTAFRKYVSQKIDKNHDGKLSKKEIKAVTTIKIKKKAKNLKGIEHFRELTVLKCYGIGLKSLNVTKNTKLVHLDARYNNLKNIDVSKNKKLQHLCIVENKLQELDVSKNTKLTRLCCSRNKIKHLDLRENTGLLTLICANNRLKGLNLFSNNSLKKVDSKGNSHKKIYVSKASAFAKNDAKVLRNKGVEVVVLKTISSEQANLPTYAEMKKELEALGMNINIGKSMNSRYFEMWAPLKGTEIVDYSKYEPIIAGEIWNDQEAAVISYYYLLKIYGSPERIRGGYDNYSVSYVGDMDCFAIMLTATGGQILILDAKTGLPLYHKYIFG